MSRERQEPIFKDCDLPVEFQASLEQYRGARIRGELADPTELSAVMQQQLKLAQGCELGFSIGSVIIKRVIKPEDVAYAKSRLAAAGISTAHELFARDAHAQVGRRRLKLPFLAVDTPEERQTSADLQYQSGFMLSQSRIEATTLVNRIKQAEKKDERPILQQRTKLGRLAGNTALMLTCIPLGDELIENPLSKADTQIVVRTKCLKLLRETRDLAHKIGILPTIDQLADDMSQLSVLWQREAPDGAWKAYHEAREIAADEAAERLRVQRLLNHEQVASLV